jgi:hypothetical protein
VAIMLPIHNENTTAGRYELDGLSVHYGPATISGFDTLAGCRAAEPIVVAFYKRTTSSAAKTECVRVTQVAHEEGRAYALRRGH